MHNNWENILKYQVMEKGKAALLKVLEAHNPDTVVVLPSDYAWHHIQLYYGIVDVTVEFDFVKITVGSQKGEKIFGFDDTGSCLRHLNDELVTNRSREELFARKVWKMYGGTYERNEDGCCSLSYQLNDGEVKLKVQSGVCTVYVKNQTLDDQVSFVLGIDDYLTIEYIEKYLKPTSAEVRAESTNFFSR